jgi:putative spermidine/putrescine transport system ATP-binding protein
MTVEQNVAFGLEMRKCPAAERAERVAQALALVHLEKHGRRYPRELSGGQRQRVALARALVIKPPVLLLDEPLSNLDAKLREEMQFELRDIQRKVGTTTIMVTHDQSEAMSISDRVVVMEAGHVTQVGRPLQVYEHPANRFISGFVGKANLLEAEVLGAAGERAELAVGDILLTLEAPDTGLRSGARALLGLRPEKIRCVAPGQGRCDGLVLRRFFLGSQWLLEAATPLGKLSVLLANDGAGVAEPGASIGLSWNDHSLRLVSSARGAAEVPA